MSRWDAVQDGAEDGMRLGMGDGRLSERGGQALMKC